MKFPREPWLDLIWVFQVDGNIGVGLHPGDDLLQPGRKGFVLPGGTQATGISPQLIRSLHQVDLTPLIGYAQGGFHSGHAAAHHKGRFGDGNRDMVKWFDMGRFGHGHAHQVFGFLRGFVRVVHVHPGVLVADIGHFEQVFVQARFSNGFPETAVHGYAASMRPPPPG